MDEAKGTPQNPLTPEEIKNKYRQCVRGIQKRNEIEKTIDLVFNLEAVKRAANLTRLLQETSGAWRQDIGLTLAEKILPRQRVAPGFSPGMQIPLLPPGKNAMDWE